MSITVVIARDDVGAPTTREVFAEGVKYEIDSGELVIITGRPQRVATYGSGNWLSVYLDDNVEVIVTKPDEDSSDSDDFSFGDFDSDSSSDDSSSDDSDDSASDSDSSDD